MVKQKYKHFNPEEHNIVKKYKRRENNFRNVGRKILMNTIGGRLRYQKFFRTLFFISCHGMNYGEISNYKEDGEQLVLQYIKENTKNPVVFDVGAYMGDYSEFILDIFENKVNLYSFEPSKENFKELKKIIGDRAKVFNIGFNDIKKKVFLYSNVLQGLVHTSGKSIYKRDLREYNFKEGNKEQIEVDTIDNFCLKNNIKKIDFLKIDAEGNELNILKGSLKMIKGDKIDYIQFETGCNMDSKDYFKDFFYLLTPRYKIYRILKDGLFHIDKYGWENEILAGANYLAIKEVERSWNLGKDVSLFYV